MNEFKPLRQLTSKVIAMPCDVCNIFVIDWFRAHIVENNEFSEQLRRKSIIQHRDTFAKELYRITLKLLDLTVENSITSEDYQTDKILAFYNTGGNILRGNDLPQELYFALLCFYRNELIKFILNQSFATDLEHILAFATDLYCHREPTVISQWIAECLVELHCVRIIHNEHKHKYN
jgi:hypothetical protein